MSDAAAVSLSPSDFMVIPGGPWWVSGAERCASEWEGVRCQRPDDHPDDHMALAAGKAWRWVRNARAGAAPPKKGEDA